MNSAAWAVIGVIVGSVLPFLNGMWSEHRADKRAERDRRERSDARLFEARQAAYEKFQSTARSLLEEAWAYMAGLPNSRPPDLDFADDLVATLGLVRLYASPPTVQAAEALLKTVNQYAESDPADSPGAEAENDAYAYVDVAIDTFASAARADLTGEVP
jgi:hypothetical protein